MSITITRSTGTAQGYTEDLGKGVGIPMIFIPSGAFMMGSPETEPQRFGDEGPQHEVILSAFCMSQYPVTNEQWRIVAGWRRVDRSLTPNPSSFKGEKNPVDSITWAAAIEFCARLRYHTGRHYSLPSEAQWEYACRAGTTTRFHFGDDLTPQLARYDWSEVHAEMPLEKLKWEQSSSSVGGFPTNAWGLYDMHGNIREWCLDDWHGNYEGAPIDGSAWINKKAGGETGKVLRGGSWFDDSRNCRSATRSLNNDVRDDYDGFRLVCLP
jgi:formylglycine-generating enzyme required for sulfatase activity